LSILKIKNFGITYYDFGYYLDIINKIELDKFNFSTYKINNIELNNHLSFVLIIFSAIIKKLSLNSLIGLSMINSLVICSCVFFFKKNNYLAIIAYCLFPVTWFNILNGFRIDVLCLPIIFGIYKSNNKSDLIFLFLSLFLILIKYYFILIVVGFLLHNLILNKKFNFSNPIKILILFIILYTFFYININYEENLIKQRFLFNSDQENIIEIIKSKLTNIHLYILLLVIFGYFYFSNIYNKKNIIFIPILIFFIMHPYNNNLVKYYYHYTLPIIPIIMLIYDEYLLKKKEKYHLNNKLIIAYLVSFHIVFSPSILSIMFWKKINNFYFYENYIFKNVNSLSVFNLKKILDENRSIKNISIENSMVINNMFQGYQIKIFPEYQFKNNINADLIILRNKEPYFLGDKNKCNNIDIICGNESFLFYYINLKEKIIKKNYHIKYKDENLIIYIKN